MTQQEQSHETGYYKQDDKVYFITSYPERWFVKVQDMFKDGTGPSQSFLTGSISEFEARVREGKLIKITEKEARASRKKTFKVTLTFDEDLKDNLKQIAKFYKMENKSQKEVLHMLIALGLRAYHDDWDERG